MARVRGVGEISRRDFLRISGAGLTGAALLGVAGCGGGGTISGGEGGGGGGGGNTFVFGRGADSVTLDPIHVTDTESSKVTRQIFDGLLDFAPESTDVAPALATEVPEPEDDGLSYTFNLRKGVKFHDGTDFNAEAVVTNFERWRFTDDPLHKGGGDQGSDFSYYTAQFGGVDDESVIKKVEALDDFTVKITLGEPQGPFLRNIAMSAFAIASPKALKDDVEGFWQKPVGTGPFKFVKWDKDSELRVEKNGNWWGTDLPPEEGGGGPNVDAIVFKSIPDNTSRVAALSGKQLSGADGLTPDDIPTVSDTDGLKIDYRPPLTIGYLAMNNTKKPFDDPKVRQAINYAIDMEKITEGFFGDTGQVASTYMPPTVPFFNDSIEPYGYDPEKAKQLLKDAGQENLETELWYMPIPRPYMPDGKGIAQVMQSDLEKVGVKVKLQTYEWGSYLDKTGRGEHPMALLGWTGDNGDPDNFLNVLLSSTTATKTDALNIAYYKNDEVDKLLKDAQTTIDDAERKDLYFQAQEILVEDAPWAPIAYAKVPVGLKQEVSGYQPSPTGGESFNNIDTGGGA
ncbi:MAG: ABC transporter substrate-binding protein [Rubrobacteraceae bacterium]